MSRAGFQCPGELPASLLELGPGSWVQPGSGPEPGARALNRAADLLQLHRDFPGALTACQRGVELLESGNSTLAELNQWEQVLGWVLELYEIPEKIPAKVLQMCIVLYSKVGEPGRMQQIVGSWLKCWTSPSALGYGPELVLELYLLHVLLPLGLYAEAEEVILDTALLTDKQRGLALQVVERRRSQKLEQWSVDSKSQVPAGSSQHRNRVHNSLFKAIQQVLRLSCRCLHLVSLRKLLLAMLLAYLLIVRLDPASPAALSWLLSLQHFIRQMWKTMFAPYYKARIDK
ncbi:peroxisome assembly protein 26 [Heterodontus francisci]|uniref:peroxisome assembly protein 26 n=1 Tax=Heterodontus francisci TaxID=7792 RepID=UPI00355C20AA